MCGSDTSSQPTPHPTTPFPRPLRISTSHCHRQRPAENRFWGWVVPSVACTLADIIPPARLALIILVVESLPHLCWYLEGLQGVFSCLIDASGAISLSFKRNSRFNNLHFRNTMNDRGFRPFNISAVTPLRPPRCLPRQLIRATIQTTTIHTEGTTSRTAPKHTPT